MRKLFIFNDQIFQFCPLYIILVDSVCFEFVSVLLQFEFVPVQVASCGVRRLTALSKFKFDLYHLSLVISNLINSILRSSVLMVKFWKSFNGLQLCFVCDAWESRFESTLSPSVLSQESCIVRKVSKITKNWDRFDTKSVSLGDSDFQVYDHAANFQSAIHRNPIRSATRWIRVVLSFKV